MKPHQQPFACPHEHDFLSTAHHANERRTWFVILLTAITMIAEIISGIVFGSMALLADGWHMASHASAMLITALAYFFTRKHKNNRNFSFGTGKINDLSGYTSALLLAVIAVIMAYESIQRLLEPTAIRYTEAIFVAVVGFMVNIVSAMILKEKPEHPHEHGHAHTHGHGHAHDHDHNLHAAYLHVLADALTSILAIIALLFGKVFGWSFLDPVMGIVGALVISRWSFGLLRATGKVLLDHNDNSDLEKNIRKAMRDAGASSVDDLHLWRIGQGRYSAIIALTSSTDAPPAQYKEILCGFNWLSHVTIEVNRFPSEDQG